MERTHQRHFQLAFRPVICVEALEDIVQPLLQEGPKAVNRPIVKDLFTEMDHPVMIRHQLGFPVEL